MKNRFLPMKSTSLIQATLAGLSLLVATAIAQEPDVEILRPGEEPPAEAGGQGSQDPQERLRQLFAKVERELEDIDILLSDASAGDTSQLAELDNAGIDDLLRNSVESGRQVQRDIEEIIDIAQQMGQQQSSSSSSSGGEPQQDSQSPGSPTSRSGQQQTPEQTPSMPEQSDGQEPGGEQQQEGEEPGGEEPGGEEPKDGEQESPEGKEPNSPLGADGDGQNKSGDDPSGADTSRGSGGVPGDDGWGNLPSHVRDTFRAEGRGDMPARYRDWIDSYYHKLNRHDSER